MNKITIGASILNADLRRLDEAVSSIERAGADMLHFDVMDGVFVDNISFGLPILEVVKSCSGMFMDVHLMITKPQRYIERFSAAGADMISFHLATACDPAAVLAQIRAQGLKAAIALSPDTPAQRVIPLLPLADMVLVMTVVPGFGGQGFISGVLPKIRELRDYITQNALSVRIQTDGGINGETASQVVEAGADILVSGSYLFKAADMPSAVRRLRANPLAQGSGTGLL